MVDTAVPGSTTDSAVLVEVLDAGLWARLNRPKSYNALDMGIVSGLHGALDQAEATPGVRAVVITGVGRSFCAGANLKDIRGNKTSLGLGSFLNNVKVLFNRVESFPLPVVAAVNGLALGGGLELLLCCDLVFASEKAQFGDSHANYGLLPGGGGSIRLPRRVGPTRAKYLMYTGESMSAAAISEWGLLNRVVPAEDLEKEVAGLINELSSKSPLGLRRMKQLVNDGLEQPVSIGLQQELLAGELHELSRDMQEGLAAFAEKREPKFVGE